MKSNENPEAQAIYEILLKDDNLRCTCDEYVRKESYFQVQGHYHHCMLWQVARAIEISLKYRDGYRLVDGKIIKEKSKREEG
jgi:calcineurin-like phosphoesterase family protein